MKDVTGGFKVEYPIAVAHEPEDESAGGAGESQQPQDGGSRPKTYANVEIDFTPPFRRLPILETLEEALGEKLPDVNSPGTVAVASCLLRVRPCKVCLLT